MIDASLNIFGVECSFNNYIFKGILDAESQVFHSGQIGIRSTLYTLTCKTCDCKQLNLINNFGDALDKKIMVDNQIYTIMDGGIQEDGELCKFILMKDN